MVFFMILLHRFTPFALGVTSIVGFAFLIFWPLFGMRALPIVVLVMSTLFARLLLWEWRRPAFWVFLGTPLLLWLSSLIFFVFLEDAGSMWVVAGGVTLGISLYAENLFTFYHLPSAYQAYALENLSLVLYVLSAFFFTSGAYGSQLFLLLPLWIPSLVIFVAVLLATVAVFWVSKIGFETGRPYAIVGAVLFTEFYGVLAQLPTSFVTNAAIFALGMYLFLALSRAYVLDRLTPSVLKRYSIFVGVLLGVVIFSAQWR